MQNVKYQDIIPKPILQINSDKMSLFLDYLVPALLYYNMKIWLYLLTMPDEIYTGLLSIIVNEEQGTIKPCTL